MFYERYVDDSNQVAIVPPPGTKYDANTKRTFIDENSPILDMKVWINKETGNIMFQHYEKPTASKNILQDTQLLTRVGLEQRDCSNTHRVHASNDEEWIYTEI